MFGCALGKVFQEERECSLGLVEHQVVHFLEIFAGCSEERTPPQRF